MPIFNDLNLDNWKESEIWTDSLWIIPERDKTGKHNGFYHGNFVPQIPHQIILRYTKKNDVVFDPFLGSGTTVKVALDLNRNAVGYEINGDYLSIIKNKLGFPEDCLFSNHSLEIINQNITIIEEDNEVQYNPSVQDADYKIDPKLLKFKKGDNSYKVVSIENNDTLILNTGLKVKLLGVIIDPEKIDELVNYLNEFVLKKEVILKYDKKYPPVTKDMIHAYVYLKNKIFINSYILKSGFAKVDTRTDYDLRYKFSNLRDNNGVMDGKGVDIKQCNESVPTKF